MSKELLGSLELNRVYQFNCLEGIKLLPDKSIDSCITSPPYYGLRDYGIEGQIGLEQSPYEYVEELRKIFKEVNRALKDDGTLWLNLGDSYAANRTYQVSDSKHTAHDFGKSNASKIPERLKAKDLIGIPWRVAFALQDDGWYLRSDIIWHKPNAMPESVTDRPTKAHEYMFLFSKNKKYYYDKDSVKEDAVSKHSSGNGFKRPQRLSYDGRGNDQQWTPTEKRNRRTVWSINTKPFKEAHFAVFPEELIEPCVLAGSRENGVILDPFMGSGTTGVVASKNNRKFIGFELNPEYICIANTRLDSVNVKQSNE